jgi:hypothetical protein
MFRITPARISGCLLRYLSQLANIKQTHGSHGGHPQHLVPFWKIAEHLQKAEDSLKSQAWRNAQVSAVLPNQTHAESIFRPLSQSASNPEDRSLLVRLELPNVAGYPAVEVEKKRLLVRLKLPMGAVQSFESNALDKQAEQRSFSPVSTRQLSAPGRNAPMRGYSLTPSTAPSTGTRTLSAPSPSSTMSNTGTAGNVSKPIQSSPLPQTADFDDERPSTSVENNILQAQGRSSLPSESTTHSLTLNELLDSSRAQKHVSKNSLTSNSSTLSHITVMPRIPASGPTNRQVLPPILPSGSSQRKKKQSGKSKTLTNESVEPPLKKQKVSEEPSAKHIAVMETTHESDFDDDIPLIQIVRQRKRQFPKPNEDSDDDVPLKTRRTLRRGSPTTRRLRTMVPDNKVNDFFVPKFEYGTRARSGARSAKTSSSPTKRHEIVYNDVQEVDVKTAIFPIKVKHPNLPGTLWEIENLEELQEEIESSQTSNKLPLPPRLQTGWKGRDLPASPPIVGSTTKVRPNPLVVFMDQAEEEFANSLFFATSSAKHTTDHPTTLRDNQIIDDAAQAWLAALRRGRIEFEARIRPLGLLDRPITTGDKIQREGDNAEHIEVESSAKEEDKVATTSYNAAHNNTREATSIDQTEGEDKEETVEGELEPRAILMMPVSEHMHLIPQVVKDSNLTQEEKVAKVHASLLIVGDFIENMYYDPEEQEERLKLWAYFGHKSWSAKENDLNAAARIRDAYARKKSDYGAQKKADGSEMEREVQREKDPEKGPEKGGQVSERGQQKRATPSSI